MKPKINYLLFTFNSLQSTHAPLSKNSNYSKNTNSESGFSSFSTFSIGVYQPGRAANLGGRRGKCPAPLGLRPVGKGPIYGERNYPPGGCDSQGSAAGLTSDFEKNRQMTVWMPPAARESIPLPAITGPVGVMPSETMAHLPSPPTELTTSERKETFNFAGVAGQKVGNPKLIDRPVLALYYAGKKARGGTRGGGLLA